MQIYFVAIFCPLVCGEIPNLLANESKEFVIIDVDAGSDDAQALLFLLYPKFLAKFQLLGITCVGGGNTLLENVYANVLRVFKIAGAEQVPLYKGCPKSILSNRSSGAVSFFGEEGFGGIGHTIKVNTSEMIKKHAVNWMYEMVQEYPGRVTLITLGPLTNAATTQILYPDFSSKLKKLHILGGDIGSNGIEKPEFNMESDPEAAHIIFNKFDCPITVLEQKTFMGHALTWDWYSEKVINGTSSAAKFMKNLDASTLVTFYEQNGFISADLFAVAIFLEPALVQKRQFYAVDVEIGGGSPRGGMLVDRLNAWNKTTKVEFITKYNKDGLASLIEDFLSNFVLNYD